MEFFQQRAAYMLSLRGCAEPQIVANFLMELQDGCGEGRINSPAIRALRGPIKQSGIVYYGND